MSEEEAPPEIPDKLYFRIGEVSRLLGVEPYVLRFWEGEFPGLSPRKSDTGHRLFRRRDVEMLLQIKHLLYEKRYTIEGARQSLSAAKTTSPKRERQSQSNLFGNEPIERIRRELEEVLAILKER